MKNFLEKKGLGFYFSAAAAVLALLGVILFGVSPENGSVAVIVLLVFAVATGILVAVKPFKFTEFLPVIFTVIPFGILIMTLLDCIAEIMFKNIFGISGAFIASLVFVVLSLVASIVGLVVKQEKQI